MKKIITFLIAFLPLLAGAQNLVVFDAGALASSKEAPHEVVLTEQYFNSPAWEVLAEKIERYGAAHAFDDAGIGDGELAEYVREIKKEMQEQARGLDRDKLREELLKHAVGGRFYYSADIYLGRLACVQARPIRDDENVQGLMDARGRMVVPARYWSIFIREWPNDSGRSLIVAYRLVSDDASEVSLFWDDGTSAAPQTYTGAKIIDEVELIGVRFPDGGWGLMNADARVITRRRYKKLDWNVNDVMDSSKGNFVYGERDGVNYIISPADGSEIGTFKLTFYEDGSALHDVNYYPGKAPKGK